MEDSKKIYKFYGKPGDDFQLWCARTEAALEAKEVLEMTQEDVLAGQALSEEVKKKVATARAVLIQGLGDRPLRMCLVARNDPFRMWKRLQDRYAVSNTATKVQLQAKLSRTSYKSESMQDYVDHFEETFNRLSAMGSEVAEDMQVAMLLASFGDKRSSPFGHVLSALQTRDTELDWETVTSTLLQEYEDQLQISGSLKAPKAADAGRALAADGRRRKNFGGRNNRGKGKGSWVEKRRCFGCNKMGHIKKNCPFKDVRPQRNLPYADAAEQEQDAEDANQARLLMAQDDDFGPAVPSKASGDTCCPCSMFEHGKHNCRSRPAGTTISQKVENLDHGFRQDGDDMSAAVGGRAINRNSDKFLVDSGASDHMVWNRNWLQDARAIEPRAIMLGDGKRVFATHRGTLSVQTFVGTPGDLHERIMVVTGVLFVPQLRSNLLSVSRLCQDGYQVNIGRHRCMGMYQGVVQFVGRMVRGIYQVVARPVHGEQDSACAARTEQVKDGQDGHPDWKLWHERLGHANIGSIKKLFHRGVVTGLNCRTRNSIAGSCSGCMKGKQTRQTLRTNTHRSKEKCAVIHTDVCGPMSVRSFSGCRYFVTFVDECSGFVVVTPIRRKSQVLEQFKIFQVWLERVYTCTVKRVHSDNGGEYVNFEFKSYLEKLGIEHSTCPSYTPNLNGIAERINRTIVECARSMLEHASLPRRFWAEAVVHAARIRNSFFCPRDQSRSSLEIMSGVKPDVRYFRTFGCLAWHHIPKELRKKLDAKSELGVVIGCMENSQYKLWIPSRNVAIVSRDVTVVEDKYPAQDWKADWGQPSPPLVEDEDVEQDAPNRTQPVSSRIPNLHHGTGVSSQDEPSPVQTPVRNDNLPGDHPADQNEEESGQGPAGHEMQDTGIPDAGQLDILTYYPGTGIDAQVEEQDAEEQDSVEGASSRYPQRERKAPSYYTPGSAKTAQDLQILEFAQPEPITVKEALACEDADDWKEAINAELKSLGKHDTWEIVKKIDGVRTLPTRFVFLRKRDEKGNVIRHKARLVVKGYLQGNVDQTFAPVVDITTVRTCLAVAVQRGYSIHQMDVRTAFLHGEIDDDVYIRSPDGLKLCETGQVLKLRRGLYGLKQAPRLWHDKWESVMETMGFKKLLADDCVYRRGDLWMLLYVDDIILMSQDDMLITGVKTELSSHLDVKDLGILRCFLGLVFLQDSKGAWLSQQHYVLQVLERFGMSECKPVSTPMCEGTLRDVMESDSPVVNKESYQELLGCLLFITTRTRPDISAAISILCRFAASPRAIHWAALKRVLRYLRGTFDYALRLTKNVRCVLVGYCDADWAGDRADRKSTTGVLLQVGNVAVAWRTLKQGSVALSTTEAEFMSLSEGTKMIMWLRKLLEELDARQSSPTPVLEDNQGAIIWSREGVRHSKHVSIRKNFVKENVARGVIKMQYCPTRDMTADVLTKPLQRVLFECHRTALGVRSPCQE